MPQERLPMRKIREVLRLDSLGLSQRQIALSCCVGQATVSNYLKAAEQAGLKWPDIVEWGEERLVEALAPTEPAAPRRESRLRQRRGQHGHRSDQHRESLARRTSWSAVTPRTATGRSSPRS